MENHVERGGQLDPECNPQSDLVIPITYNDFDLLAGLAVRLTQMDDEEEEF